MQQQNLGPYDAGPKETPETPSQIEEVSAVKRLLALLKRFRNHGTQHDARNFANSLPTRSRLYVAVDVGASDCITIDIRPPRSGNCTVAIHVGG